LEIFNFVLDFLNGEVSMGFVETGREGVLFEYFVVAVGLWFAKINSLL